MNPNLFKSAEFYQRRYHNFATYLIIPSILLFSFLSLYSLIAQKEITVTSQGEISPTTIIASIQSTSNNPILENHLINQQTVQKDDLLIQYADTMESSQKQSLENQLDSYQRQKSGLETLIASLEQQSNLFSDKDEFGYENTFQQFIKQSQDIELGITKNNTETHQQNAIAHNTLTAINQQMSTISQQITEYKELYSAISNHSGQLPQGNPHQDILNDYLSKNHLNQDTSLHHQYLAQVKQNIAELQSSLDHLSIQRAGIGNTATYDNSLEPKIEVLRNQFLQTAAQQLTTVKQQITDIDAQLKQAISHSSNNQIKAPENGIIHLNSDFEGKHLIPAGSEIAQIYPDIKQSREVLITYYVPSHYLPLLKENQTVRLTLEKVGQQPITVTGKLYTIAQTATKTKQGNLFKMNAKVTLSKKESSIIQYGLQGRVTSVIATKTFFDYYKDKLWNTIE